MDADDRWEYARFDYRSAGRRVAGEYEAWDATFTHPGGVERWATDERFGYIKHLNRAGELSWAIYAVDSTYHATDPYRLRGVTYAMRRPIANPHPVRWEYARFSYRGTGTFADKYEKWDAAFIHPGGVQRWGTDDRFDDIRHLNRAGGEGWYAHTRSVLTDARQSPRILSVACIMRRPRTNAVRWEYARLEYRAAGTLGTDRFEDWDAVFIDASGIQRWGTDERFDDVKQLNRVGASHWEAYERNTLTGDNELVRPRFITYSLRRPLDEPNPPQWEYARLEYRATGTLGNDRFEDWNANFRASTGLQHWGTDERFDDIKHLNRAGQQSWHTYNRGPRYLRDEPHRLRAITYSMRRLRPLQR